MRIRVVRTVLTPTQGYVCVSCRLQNAGTERGRSRRYVHSSPPNDHGDEAGTTPLPKKEEKAKGVAPGSAARIRDMIRGFMFKQTAKDGERHGSENGNKPESLAVSNHEPPPTRLKDVADNTEAMRGKLHSKFLALRHKQMLEHQASQVPKAVSINQPSLKSLQVSDSAKPGSKKTRKRALERGLQRSRKVASKPAKVKETTLKSPQISNSAKPGSQKPRKRALQQPRMVVSNPAIFKEPTFKSFQIPNLVSEVPPPTMIKELAFDAPQVPNSLKAGAQTRTIRTPRREKAKLRKVAVKISRPVRELILDPPQVCDSAEPPAVTPTVRAYVGGDAEVRKVASIKTRLMRYTRPLAINRTPRGRDRGTKPPQSEEARKAELAKKLVPMIKDYQAVKRSSSTTKETVTNKSERLVRRVSKKSKESIEQVDATELEILPLKIEQPTVPGLAYGLERVLFNPGVYQLQDPRSRVYNFDPYLQDIMPVSDFDFNALKEYITSSRDKSLKNIAKEHAKRYVGSTSSMTGALAHFHFLLSQWRPINTSMLSKSFPTRLSSFTELQRTPSAIFLRWKDGVYAIDADKQFDTGNVLSMLGKSMEKLLTLKTEDYERYRKSTSGEVTEDEQLAPESYHYSTMGDFLMRSQLDAHDARLPGTGMFDLKTRAVVSIRMDVTKYEHGIGYQIKSRQGEWESYEREYYDMIRAAFLKYSMQVRMGRMDGIFVAFHNIERIFGFQYISLPEMDSTIHGQWDTSIGDQEFKLSLNLLNKILNKATKKFPETSLRIHFETRDTATPFMYIFAEPVTEEQVAEIQGQNQAKMLEFERKILGLSSAEESQDQVTREDDGRWDDIQASVQEAMDKDALSVDDPFEDQQSEDGDVEEHDALPDGQKIIEEGPLYANRERILREEDRSAETAVGDANDLEEDEDRESAEEVVEGDEEQVEEEADEESEENAKVESEEENELEDVDVLEDPAEAIEEDSAVTKDPADSHKTLEGRTASTNEDPIAMRIEASDPARKEEEGQTESEAEIAKPPATGQSTLCAEKSAYIPPVLGEEPTGSKYPTEADSPFLDAMDEETARSHADASSSEILAMSLTLRNKVNHKFVHRPEKLKPDDVWSIEYSLVEVPTQKRAHALYEACQTRRKKKLDAPEVPEGAEVINQYLAHLRELSKRGKQWRKKMDERDRERPVQVLGRDIAKKDVEDRSNDQDSQA